MPNVTRFTVRSDFWDRKLTLQAAAITTDVDNTSVRGACVRDSSGKCGEPQLERIARPPLAGGNALKIRCLKNRACDDGFIGEIAQ